MKTKVLISVLFISIIGTGISQSFGNSAAFFDDGEHQRIDLEGGGYFGSNVMDIETMTLFYQGGFFDNDLKSESLGRLGANNFFGAEYGGRISYLNPDVVWLDSAGIYVTYEMNGGGGVSFTEDLFRLVFEGNQRYLGDSAFFSGTEFSAYAFHKIGFGYNKGDRLKVGLSLLQFDNYTFGSISKGTYYSDPNADSLQLRLAGSWVTDSRKNRNSPIGVGVGVDFEINLPYKDEDTMNLPRLVFGVKNFGAFISTKQMRVLEVDTLYRYSGMELNNLSDFQSGLYDQNNLQDSLLPASDYKRIVRFLPFELYFYSNSNPNGKKMQLVYGMRYKFRVAMIPQIYLGGDWRPTPKTIITPFLSFGGYSYLKTGLSVRKEFGNLRVGVSFNNIPGFFTKEAYQKSISMSLSYAIK